jgi:hypothetical protein
LPGQSERQHPDAVDAQGKLTVRPPAGAAARARGAGGGARRPTVVLGWGRGRGRKSEAVCAVPRGRATGLAWTWGLHLSGSVTRAGPGHEAGAAQGAKDQPARDADGCNEREGSRINRMPGSSTWPRLPATNLTRWRPHARAWLCGRAGQLATRVLGRHRRGLQRPALPRKEQAPVVTPPGPSRLQHLGRTAARCYAGHGKVALMQLSCNTSAAQPPVVTLAAQLP